MRQRLRLDGVDHDVDRLSAQARQILEQLRFVEQRLQELHNEQALLTKAKNAYIVDLKSELLRPAQPVPSSGQGGSGLMSFLRDDESDTF